MGAYSIVPPLCHVAVETKELIGVGESSPNNSTVKVPLSVCFSFKISVVVYMVYRQKKRVILSAALAFVSVGFVDCPHVFVSRVLGPLPTMCSRCFRVLATKFAHCVILSLSDGRTGSIVAHPFFLARQTPVAPIDSVTVLDETKLDDFFCFAAHSTCSYALEQARLLICH